METVENLPLIGGNPALDLVNTTQRGIPLPGAANHDHLQTPDDLVVWSERVGLISPDEAGTALAAFERTPADGAEALRRVRLIREALYDALLAIVEERPSDEPVRQSLDVLRQSWIRAVQRSEFDLSGPASHGSPDPALIRRLRVGKDPAHVITDRIAVAAAETLRDVQPERLRQCPVDEGGCGWLFVDRSRNGSRRWCRMADCGTQVKSRRLTERRRQHPPKEVHAPRRTP